MFSESQMASTQLCKLPSWSTKLPSQNKPPSPVRLQSAWHLPVQTKEASAWQLAWHARLAVPLQLPVQEAAQSRTRARGDICNLVVPSVENKLFARIVRRSEAESALELLAL